MALMVYSYYVLDLLHKGHLEMLRNCRAIAGPEGKLVVGILTDQAVMERKPRPALPFEQRLEIARALKMVDLVVAQTDYSPLRNCVAMRPDVLMESSSHQDKDIIKARGVLAEWGGRVIVIPYYPLESSTSIKHRIVDGPKAKAQS